MRYAYIAFAGVCFCLITQTVYANGFLRVGKLSGAPDNSETDNWVEVADIKWTVSDKGVKHGIFLISESDEAVRVGLLLPAVDQDAEGATEQPSGKLRKLGRLNYRQVDGDTFVKMWKFEKVFIENRRASGEAGNAQKIRFAYGCVNWVDRISGEKGGDCQK